MNPNQTNHDNCFALFDLPEELTLDLAVLQKRYETLQKHYHPDRFSQGSATEQRLALALSATINSAYQTLKDPLARSAHLLARRGIYSTENSLDNKSLLNEQWQWREHLDEAQELSEVSALKVQIQQNFDQTFAELGNLLSQQLSETNQQIILQHFHRLQFFAKLLQEVEKKHRSMM